MQDQQFDQFTKRMASPVTRRTMFITAMATAVGGVVGLGGISSASAESDGKCYGLRCNHDHQCCTKFCDPSSGTCGCGAGMSECKGACLKNCTGGQILNSSDCTCECSTGSSLCGGNCVANCAGNQTLNAACQCTCPVGQEFCTTSKLCQAACTGGQVLNQATCTCV